MKKSWVVGLIVGVHVVGIGALMLMPGCGTTRTKSLDAPTGTVMPPTTLLSVWSSEARPKPIEASSSQERVSAMAT